MEQGYLSLNVVVGKKRMGIYASFANMAQRASKGHAAFAPETHIDLQIPQSMVAYSVPNTTADSKDPRGKQHQ